MFMPPMMIEGVGSAATNPIHNMLAYNMYRNMSQGLNPDGSGGEEYNLLTGLPQITHDRQDAEFERDRNFNLRARDQELRRQMGLEMPIKLQRHRLMNEKSYDYLDGFDSDQPYQDYQRRMLQQREQSNNRFSAFNSPLTALHQALGYA